MIKRNLGRQDADAEPEETATGKAPTPSSNAVPAPDEPPASYGRRTAAAKPPVEDAQVTATERTCLLVDDSRMIRKLSRKIVEERGYRVAEAENGEEALAKCALAMPDLIILDWDMPVMTGIEFLAELRKCESAERPKVVFCTSHSGVQDIHKAVDIGADEFITKPFDTQSLLAKLKLIGAD